MNPGLLNAIGEDLRKRYGVDPLSREFIFGAKFADDRNGAILGGDRMRDTLLSVLLREAVSEDHRAGLFPEKFDLGSREPVSADDCTYDALAGELNAKLDKADATVDSDTFKTIREGIQNLTGQKMAVYAQADKLIMLKVIKLFYHVMRERDEDRIFGLLNAPDNLKRKAGLEFREAYPNSMNKEGTWLVADLKSYLSLELSETRIEEIDLTFSQLMPVVESIDTNAAQAILKAHGRTVPGTLVIYPALTASLDDFRTGDGGQSVPRLDEALYVYVSSLEFRHFARVYPSLIEIATPVAGELQVTPITGELDELASAIVRACRGLCAFGTLKPATDLDCRIRLEYLPGLAEDYAREIRTLVARATGVAISERAYEQSFPYVHGLLVTVCTFEPGQTLVEEKLLATFRQVVAAFCAIHYELNIRKIPSNHKPYWHSQQAQGGSLRTPLLAPVWSTDRFEEHSQIWRCRLDWFQAAIRGETGLHDARTAFRAALIRNVAEIAKINDTAILAENLSTLIDFVKRECFATIRLAQADIDLLHRSN